ncbi:phage tail assembly chaperone [Paraburkholderia sp. RL18-103-BIB-C]|uniref:XkdW family protein n=1 Tax=Paraburkholderia sp. RL18-103-BIB-C TaxID=3031637 RepID=UPI0038B87757
MIPDFDLQGYTHDLMAMAIVDMFPEIRNAYDFITAHPIGDNGLQCGKPFIAVWRNKDIEQPSDESVHEHFRVNDARLRARFIRGLRNEALANTDHFGAIPTDAPQGFTKNVAEWLVYRQALRDMPQQAGFPFKAVWPKRPK